MATPDEVHVVLGVLSAAHPTFPLTEATISVYVQCLSDIPADVLQASALQQIANEKWFPTVSDLRGQVRAIVNPGILAPTEAWGEVVRAIEEGGSYKTPTFSDITILEAVRLIGGWRYLCLSENSVADRARFLEAYRDLKAKGMRELSLLPNVRKLIDKLQDRKRLKE
jgi:hypothetical protein